jgi:hypothetical protein
MGFFARLSRFRPLGLCPPRPYIGIDRTGLYDYILNTRAPIAQLDRVPDYESVGRVFESPWARQRIQGVSRTRLAPFF